MSETETRDVVERLRAGYSRIVEDLGNGVMLSEVIPPTPDMLEAADMIDRLRLELEKATKYVTRLACSVGDRCYPDVPQWRPLPDLEGVISQLDNMATGLVRADPPMGWRVARVDPTPQMMQAAQVADMDHSDHVDWLDDRGCEIKRIYSAMLEASPTPSSTSGDET